MTKAYSYARWSDARQGKGDSEDRQLSAARDYALVHGLDLDTSLVDRGISGCTGANRKWGDLGRFLEMVELGIVQEGEYLLVDSMDRLSRLPLNEAAAQMLNLANAGVRIVTLNDGMLFDRNVELPTMINAVLKMQGAHDYSKELGRKVKRGHAAAKRKARDEGRIYSKTGPGWLLVNPDRTGWLPVPERIALVRQVFEWADSGGLGQRVVANRLNAAHQPPFRGGKGWHEAAIRKLLQNRMVLGEYQPHFADGSADGDPILGYYGPGIIEPAQFYRVQSRFGRPGRGRGNSVDVINNLLQGICRCGLCEGTVGVSIRSKDKRHLYVCRNTGEGMLCGNRTRYGVVELEAALLKHLTDADLSLERASAHHGEALTTALAERGDLQTRIQTFVQRMESPDWAADEFVLAHHRNRVAQLKTKDAEVEQLKSALDQTKAKLTPAHYQQTVRELRGDLQRLRGEALYDARASVSVALKSVVDLVYFASDPWGDPVVTVWMLGGAKVLVIRPKEGVTVYDMSSAIIAEAERDPAFLAQFTGGAPQREAQLRRLASTAVG